MTRRRRTAALAGAALPALWLLAGAGCRSEAKRWRSVAETHAARWSFALTLPEAWFTVAPAAISDPDHGLLELRLFGPGGSAASPAAAILAVVTRRVPPDLDPAAWFGLARKGAPWRPAARLAPRPDWNAVGVRAAYQGPDGPHTVVVWCFVNDAIGYELVADCPDRSLPVLAWALDAALNSFRLTGHRQPVTVTPAMLRRDPVLRILPPAAP